MLTSGDLHNPVVLIVEDTPILSMFAADVAKDCGFVTIEVNTVSKALSALEDRDDIAIVVSDIILGGRRDGFELMREAKERWPHLAFILNSSFTSADPANLPENVVFMPKPMIPDNLSAQLQHFWQIVQAHRS